MTLFKKYWKQLVGMIAALFFLIIATIKLLNNRNLKKSNEKLQDNNNEINRLKGKADRVVEEKAVVEEQIEQHKNHVDELESLKKTPTVRKRTTEQSKQNILNKTIRK